MKKITIAAALAGLATASVAPSAVADSAQPVEEGVIATFEGQRFDMSDGWGEPETRSQIRACHVTESDATCYRSEDNMTAAIGEPHTQGRAASCSSSLRLYDGTSKTGAVLSLTTRRSLISLSSHGFNNRTSSYAVGGCSSTLYNGIGTSPYPGNTSAWASANSMYSGWNNTISSVYIS